MSGWSLASLASRIQTIVFRLRGAEVRHLTLDRRVFAFVFVDLVSLAQVLVSEQEKQIIGVIGRRFPAVQCRFSKGDCSTRTSWKCQVISLQLPFQGHPRQPSSRTRLGIISERHSEQCMLVVELSHADVDGGLETILIRGDGSKTETW